MSDEQPTLGEAFATAVTAGRLTGGVVGDPVRLVQMAVPKMVSATLELRCSDGSRSIITYVPPDDGTLEVELRAAVPPPDMLPDEPSALIRSSDQPVVHEVVVKGAAMATQEFLVRGVPGR